MTNPDPDWKPVAFKEWQLVSDAIACGEQSILLRKGGISEGKLGFQWLHDRFFLFPSYFHEQVDQVQPAADGSARPLPPPRTDQQVSFSVYIEILNKGRLENWDDVARLAPYHIWSEEVVRERFAWGDSPGISWAVIQARVLEDPWTLEDRKAFGGCRSWIGLPREENGGCLTRLRQARLVENHCGIPEWLH